MKIKAYLQYAEKHDMDYIVRRVKEIANAVDKGDFIEADKLRQQLADDCYAANMSTTGATIKRLELM